MFVKYQHIERRFDLSKTRGILDSGSVILQPKLDGSNCSMWFEDGEIHIASRNNELSYQKDNHGCYNTLINDPRYKAFFEEYPDIRLYGEWLCPHKIKYREDAYNKFYIFDSMFGNNSNLLLSSSTMLGFELNHVPRIMIKSQELTQAIQNNTVFEDYKELGNFLIDSDVPAYEGLVVKNYSDWRNGFGLQTWVKLINDEVFRNGARVRKIRAPVVCTRETEFISTVDQHVFSKEYHKVENFENKHIGIYIRNCQNEIFEDYIKDHIEKEGITDWNHKASNNLIANMAIKYLTEIREDIHLKKR
jgi:hypothetical protein